MAAIDLKRVAALLAGEPYPISSPEADPSVPVLGEGGYDIRPVAAPVATGLKLRVLEYVLTRTPIGRWLRRTLLTLNSVHKVRELAAQVGTSAPVVYQPVRSLSAAQHAAHAELAAAPESAAALRAGWPSHALPPHRPCWSVEDYAAAYRDGRTEPLDVARAVLAGAAQLQHLRPFVCLDGARLLADAAASAERHRRAEPLGVWDGVPVAIKDELDVAGLPTTHGTHHAAPPAERDDVLVARLRAAGALIVGKTSMHEVGVQPLGFNCKLGGPRNPFDPGRYPGGSSSGSAVAVSCGLVPVAIGLDGGGSIRIPAALSGCVGLAPTFGSVPVSSRSAYLSSMVHVGPLATCVRDAALAHLLLARPVHNHPYTQLYGLDGPPPPHCAALHRTRDLRGVRVGVMRAQLEDAQPDVVRACRAALGALEAHGATLVEVAIPHMHALSLAHGLAIAAEFGAAHDRDSSRGHAFEPPTRINLGLASALTAPELLACNRLRGWAFALVRELFGGKVDALATPTTPCTAPPLRAAAEQSGESNTGLIVALMKHIFLANLLGLPALSVPVGYGADGLPIGLQLVGAHYDEATVLRLAHAVELSAELPRRRAPPAAAFFDLPAHLGLGARAVVDAADVLTE